ncbi:restriction endonuclease [Helicobacter bilis]|uniref:Restriction endonuclease type IV Mrr domain-containing protein n=1 Tax=Helicobacter bilis TaxID=37372 RepID=A0A4U8U8A5_9HELI|nr:restriction endonuclease [Helicobacter bilis]MCI7411309.1 restriction endonuclease [Helicobacter bilis]MDD7297483.1 restriction endonuclease [Helicobacter bilis]MDY4399530.1 restriction endonuclease [Helicobacter bilis]TLE07840.1 hypothetical protein LS78_007435 [Helicobacter bilis]TLE09654.1 hypothetical protein LS79_007515 [Helicobacter bilis]
MEFLFIAFVVSIAFLLLYKPKRKKFVKTEDYAVNYAAINKQKGDDYERQIGRFYQQQGYKVYFKGIKEGRRDQGIDLIAYKGREAILIQCKNWENTQVKQEHLRIFLGDCTAYLEQNQKIFAKKNVSRVFVTSCENLDYGVKKFLEENSMEYRIIPYERV